MLSRCLFPIQHIIFINDRCHQVSHLTISHSGNTKTTALQFLCLSFSLRHNAYTIPLWSTMVQYSWCPQKSDQPSVFNIQWFDSINMLNPTLPFLNSRFFQADNTQAHISPTSYRFFLLLCHRFVYRDRVKSGTQIYQLQ